MASIHTLVQDIYDLLETGEAKLDYEAIARDTFFPYDGTPRLRMSNFATPDKQLWFAVNKPELGEPIRGRDLLKFKFGHFWEPVLLELAEQAGHKVEGKQAERHLHGITGHIDAIIDGVLVDVKTASTRAIEKFEKHRLGETDPFGYLDQMSLYLEASKDDDRVQVKSQGAFLAINKETGKIVLDIYPKLVKDYEYEINRKLEMLARPTPPDHCCDPVPFGKSGNMALGIRCSYNPYKYECHPGLRGFLYANKPVWLTRVVREPDVPEIKR